MPDIHKDTLTNQPSEGVILEVVTPGTKKTRVQLESEITSIITVGVSQRWNFDQNLDLFTNLYEMKVSPKDEPWEGASNVFIPVVPTILDTIVSRLMQTVVPQRLFVVRGVTDSAVEVQYQVERYYNKQLYDTDWVQAIYDWIFLAARDGTALMEVVWEHRTHKMKTLVWEPKMVDGAPMPDPDNPGQLIMESHPQDVEVIEYNNVQWNPIELRDFYMFPAWARNIEEAPTVGVIKYLSEWDLKAMVRSGDMEKEPVQYVIDTFIGDELPMNDHTAPYSLGGQIDVSTRDTPSIPEHKASYFKVWRLHTHEFDLDGDDIPEEYIIWYHFQTQRILGIQAYQYMHGKRCLVPLSLMPRPNRSFGWGVPERASGVQQQINATHNQRNDQIDLRTSPPMYKTANVQERDEDMGFGPTQEYTVMNPTDIGLIQMPEVPLSSWQEEEQLYNYAREMLGLFDPTVQGNSQRTSRYQAQMANQFISIRIAMMGNNVQRALQKVFWQTHQLKIQYGPDQDTVQVQNQSGAPEKLTVSKQMLLQDFELGINGQGSPLDKSTKRQELLFLYQTMSQNPLVAGNLLHMYALTREVLENFDIDEMEAIIGKPEEAQQQMQKQAQDQEQMRQAQLKALELKGQFAQAEGGAMAKHPTGRRGRKPKQQPFSAGGQEGAPQLVG